MFNPYNKDYIVDTPMYKMFERYMRTWFGIELARTEYQAFCRMCEKHDWSFTIAQCAQWMKEKKNDTR